MPRFRWLKWSHDTSAQTEASSWRCPKDRPRHELIQELLWHVQERRVRSLELEHPLTRGLVDHPRFQTIIPTSELDQLETLCAGISPVCAAAVISRFHEVLAASKVMPLGLISVFKRVLTDVDQRKCGEDHNLSEKATMCPPTAFWANNKLEPKVEVSSSDEKSREEIPTVSGYVDKVMWYTTWLTGRREWELPYYYPVPTQWSHGIQRGNSPE
ncbi:protein RD3-like [Stigmatopora argus]